MIDHKISLSDPTQALKEPGSEAHKKMHSEVHGQAAAKELYDKTLFGFWLYLLTDCILFASLFATYVVLRNNVYGGPTARELLNPTFALGETLILLTSSFTCALAGLFTRNDQKKWLFFWYGITFLLGVSFLCLEMHEFMSLVREGNDWQKSAFLSAFFTLVATHGLHITVGLLWIGVMMVQVCWRGFTEAILRRLKCLSLFWHFLDVVWIFIYSVVYLMGAS